MKHMGCDICDIFGKEYKGNIDFVSLFNIGSKFKCKGLWG